MSGNHNPTALPRQLVLSPEMWYKMAMRSLGAITLLVLFLAVTVFRNALWLDEEGIWLDAIGNAPRKARAYNELGLHYLAAGQHQKGFRLLARSLELDPYQPAVYVNLGLAYERLNDVDRAVKTYERAIWLNPGDPTAYYNLGVLTYSTLKDPDRAFGYFLKARDLNPLEPDVHEHLARIYLERGDRDRAAEETALFRRLKH